MSRDFFSPVNLLRPSRPGNAGNQVPPFRQNSSWLVARTRSRDGSTIAPRRANRKDGLATRSGIASQPASGHGSGCLPVMDQERSIQGQPADRLTVRLVLWLSLINI